MIIGTGLLADTFSEYKNNKDFLIFASGVSNSSETSLNNFKREKSLLLREIKNNQKITFIYFGTCSIYDSSLSSSLYIQHKLEMESLIRSNHNKYFIFRLPNMVGLGGNKKTLLNFLVNKIKSESDFILWKNSTRNILDVEDARLIIDCFLKHEKPNQVLNIANDTSFKIIDIVKEIEKFLKKEAKYKVVNKGEKIDISIDNSLSCFKKKLSDKTIDIGYISLLLNKYY